MLPYEHIVAQNKNKTDVKHLNVVVKNTIGATENKTYNFVWQITCMHISIL